MGWLCGAYGWGEGVYRVLVGNPEGKRPLGRPRRRWVDNIRTDIRKVGCECMDWIGLAQDRDRWWTLVSAVMNFRVPWNAGNLLTSCKPVSFSRRTLHHRVSKWDRWTMFLSPIFIIKGTAVAQWLRCCATNRKVAGSIPAGFSGFFINIKSFRSHYGPWVDSASNRNEY